MSQDIVQDWPALQDAIDGEVALPGSPLYENIYKPFNARFHEVQPIAIVRCATAQDVVETISFLKRYGLENAIRSGGHCFAGNSSTRGVVIDVTPMDSVLVSNGVATIGAGARLGDVYEALQKHNATIPAGTCPPVGIAGLTLGGGLGILGRRYGVTSDLLIGAQIVLADGRILDCDESQNGDLFWALRGAGSGNFGIVTSLVFRTIPVPEITNFHLAWPFDHASRVIEAWQQWAPNGPDELAASLKITAADVKRRPTVDIYGALTGTPSDATGLLEELVLHASSDPISASSEQMTFSQTRHFWANLGGEDTRAEGTPAAQPPYLFAKSEFFSRQLPSDAVASLLNNFSQGRVTEGSRELDFMPWGGAYNRVRPDATAFVHRNELFQLKHAVTIGPEAPPSTKAAARTWVLRSWESVHPWGSGRVFQNFMDEELQNWADAYYGTNYERLIRVKAQYDPKGFFRFQQCIPAP